MKTVNKLIAVEKFPKISIEKVMGKNGLVGVSQKTTLTALKVILNSEDDKYLPGDTVYVRGDLCADPAVNVVYEIDGKEFILMPEQYVKLASYAPRMITGQAGTGAYGVGGSGVVFTGGTGQPPSCL